LVQEKIVANIFEYMGDRITGGITNTGYTTRLFFEQFAHMRAFFSKFSEILRQMYVTGIQSMGVTLVVALFIGMVLALQTGLSLRPMGLESVLSQITGVAMVREMGPLMTAIILAGRVGSAMAAEIGTMRVSEEIDALEIMSINPVRFLVMPRVIALTLMAPLLTIYADFVGIIGGAIVAATQVGINPDQFFHDCFEMIEYRDLYSGLLKSFVFGIIVAIVSCSEGMRARGGAEGVGRSTRKAVVNSLLGIIIANYIMTTIIQRLFYPV
jgi:phospholipid/cholesterol/gamma-HCH transport system permease protein